MVLLASAFCSALDATVSNNFVFSNPSVSLSYQSQPSFQTLYGANIATYWPQLQDTESCQARQDIVLNIAPEGCTPVVVRSDLLAEQNVPVFCPISALKLNPLLDIKGINNIRFTGNYPKEVAGTGFYPAQAALQTRDNLLGSPTLGNIGYVVVVLKQNEKESTLPSFVNLTLSAQLEYNAGNAFGIGRADFNLRKVTDEEWNLEKIKNSFWNGRYSVRLIEVDAESATIAIYDGDSVVATQKIKRGVASDDIYLPGTYCSGALNIYYDKLTANSKSVLLDIYDGSSMQKFEAYEGSSFLNDKCVVNSIDIAGSQTSGSVSHLTLSDIKPTFYAVGSDIGQHYANVGTRWFALSTTGSWGEVNSPSLTGLLRYGGELGDLSGSESFVTSFVSAYNQFSASPGGSGQSATVKLRCGSLITSLTLTKGASIALREDSLTDAAQEKYFQDTIAAYLKVFSDYPNDKIYNIDSSETYGELALYKAVQFIRTEEGKGIFKSVTEKQIIEKFINAYPSSTYYNEMKNIYNNLDKKDSTKAVWSINLDNGVKTILLDDFSIPAGVLGNIADFSIDSTNIKLGFKKVGDFKAFSRTETSEKDLQIEKVTLKDIASDNEVSVAVNCRAFVGGGKTATVNVQNEADFTFRDGDVKQVCPGVSLRLNNVNFTAVAQIRIIPKTTGTEGAANVTVTIGIEKRGIQLSPQETADKIKDLNASIDKWQSISTKLGNVVKGLQETCIATGLILTVKNFISGIGGTATARQQTMDRWDKFCSNQVAAGKYDKSLSKCFGENKDAINGEIAGRNTIINDINNEISTKVENQQGVSSGGGLISEKVVDQEAAKKAYLTVLKDKYRNDNDFTKSFGDNIDPKSYSYSDMRDWEYNKMLAAKNINADATAEANSALEGLNKKIASNVAYNAATQKNVKDIATLYNANVAVAGSQDYKPVSGTIMKLDSAANTLNGKAISIAGATTLPKEYNSAMFVQDTKANEYLVVGTQTGNTLDVAKVYDVDKTNKLVTGESTKDINSLKTENKISVFQNAFVYNYEIASTDKVVRYFESGVDSGKAAIVPFDLKNGWYAQVKQSLNIGDQQTAYDKSGLPRNWYICNVGYDGKVGSDDECQLVIEGVSTSASILGLGTTDSAKLVRDSRQALIDATRQKGSALVTINGQKLSTGVPMSATSGTKCQDFMSIDDCNILFNICDPVICPASRCDFGGKYHVSDVIQSGVIGSALLCLPNFGNPATGGVAIPVCLTGIEAGIDSYLSILKSYQQCLQESLTNGRTVGVCDEIQSIYLCEFFWRQASPFTGLLIPKLVESFYGGAQSSRGGGEYLTVNNAWTNAKNSMNYFTQTYGGNALQAFNLRSVDTILESAVCKKEFISLQAPTSIGSLIQPESPYQFSAWFSQILFSDVTIPATSQYKVFYHIFAGNNQGVYFSVYLRNPPTGTFASYPPTVQVASGFIAQGQFKTETKDFTAPQGYKELCVSVNGKENCGFGEVSTDFALNSLSDQYAANQIQQKEITSASACVGGTSDVGALINPNLQAGVQQAISPQIYNRGVVRICASRNPGTTTAPSRYQDVGYCDDTNLRCWLDLQSVNNAISDANTGLKNETMQALGQNIQQTLAVGAGALSEADGISQIKAIEDAINKVDVSNITKTDAIFSQIDSILSKLYLNNQKAKILVAKASLLERIALNYLVGKVGTPTVPPETPVQKAAETEAAISDLLYLNNPYNVAGTNIKIFSQGDKDTGITLLGLNVMKQGIKIGSVSHDAATDSYDIIIDKAQKDTVNNIGTGFYDYLNGASVKTFSRKITPSPVPIEETSSLKPCTSGDATGVCKIQCASGESEIFGVCSDSNEACCIPELVPELTKSLTKTDKYPYQFLEVFNPSFIYSFNYLFETNGYGFYEEQEISLDDKQLTNRIWLAEFDESGTPSGIWLQSTLDKLPVDSSVIKTGFDSAPKTGLYPETISLTGKSYVLYYNLKPVGPAYYTYSLAYLLSSDTNVYYTLTDTSGEDIRNLGVVSLDTKGNLVSYYTSSDWYSDKEKNYLKDVFLKYRGGNTGLSLTAAYTPSGKETSSKLSIDKTTVSYNGAEMAGIISQSGSYPKLSILDIKKEDLTIKFLDGSLIKGKQIVLDLSQTAQFASFDNLKNFDLVFLPPGGSLSINQKAEEAAASISVGTKYPNQFSFNLGGQTVTYSYVFDGAGSGAPALYKRTLAGSDMYVEINFNGETGRMFKFYTWSNAYKKQTIETSLKNNLNSAKFSFDFEGQTFNYNYLYTIVSPDISGDIYEGRYGSNPSAPAGWLERFVGTTSQGIYSIEGSFGSGEKQLLTDAFLKARNAWIFGGGAIGDVNSQMEDIWQCTTFQVGGNGGYTTYFAAGWKGGVKLDTLNAGMLAVFGDAGTGASNSVTLSINPNCRRIAVAQVYKPDYPNLRYSFQITPPGAKTSYLEYDNPSQKWMFSLGQVITGYATGGTPIYSYNWQTLDQATGSSYVERIARLISTLYGEGDYGGGLQIISSAVDPNLISLNTRKVQIKNYYSAPPSQKTFAQ